MNQFFMNFDTKKQNILTDVMKQMTYPKKICQTYFTERN